MSVTASQDVGLGARTWATFEVAGETLALSVDDVQEVLMFKPLAPVPLAPPHILGLLNLRGHVMPVIDLRRRLRGAPGTVAAQRKLVVVSAHDRLQALLVDEIGEVLELPGEAWRPTPATVADAHRPFLFGLCPTSRGLILGLSLDAIVADDDGQ